jgi:hypothetical protein
LTKTENGTFVTFVISSPIITFWGCVKIEASRYHTDFFLRERAFGYTMILLSVIFRDSKSNLKYDKPLLKLPRKCLNMQV